MLPLSLGPPISSLPDDTTNDIPNSALQLINKHLYLSYGVGCHQEREASVPLFYRLKEN